jgi:hypothetical protein
MKNLGLCTHFAETDEWAFQYAFNLARTHQLHLIICHWLESPYQIRRDIVYNDLFDPQKTIPISPEVLNKFELQLRQYYEPKLGDFTDVAFKLCEGAYQVELTRCFRQHLLDLVVMGYQAPSKEGSSTEQPLELFAMNLQYPIVIVGPDGPDTFLLNPGAFEKLNQLALPEGSWQLLEDANVSWQVLRPA